MDRPEDMGNPVTGAVYAVMTNNSRRTAAQVDAANPRPDNRHGHIIEILEAGNDPSATTFRWALSGEPSDPSTYFAGFPKDKVSTFSCPDNITFDQVRGKPRHSWRGRMARTPSASFFGWCGVYCCSSGRGTPVAPVK